MHAETGDEVKRVKISHEPIDLFKILKFQNLVSSGGEAKQAIADGLVQVNGEVETQKRKKIYSGDVINFAGMELEIYNPNQHE
ncbi:MAG: RNA-binding S4 domain-containing protein [Spartobacteria bacterium]|nr:RNA-binding S4 domain-containing protein [Spartobacteria bacterium]